MTKRKDTDNAVKRFILDSIDSSGYDVETNTIQEKIVFLRKTFNSEYGWRVAQLSKVPAIAEWLRGLPSSIHIPYWNCDVTDFNVKFERLPVGYTDNQEQKALDDYWLFLANKIDQLFRGYRVPKELETSE